MPNEYISKKSAKKIEYLLFENMNLTFTKAEVKKFDYLWKEGLCINDIAKYLKRDINEVNLLVFDRSAKGRIQKRKGGLHGTYGSNYEIRRVV